MSAPENEEYYRNILSQCGIPDELQSVPLYTIEVALAHLMPTIIFFKANSIKDESLKNKIVVIRNALAHAGEVVDGNRPNIELTEQGGIVFRTRNWGGQEVIFNSINELADFITNLNSEFADTLE